MIFSDWCNKSLLWSHSITENSLSVSASFYAIIYEPSKKWSFDTVNAYNFILSRISFLFRLFNPTNIKWAIRAVSINSVNSKCFSIRQKCIKAKSDKGLLPHRTNNNSSTAIIFISGIFWIVTSTFYTLPNSIKSRFRQIMRSRKSFMNFAIKASTTTSSFINKAIAQNNCVITTTTKTFYHKLSLLVPTCDAFYKQATKTFSDNICQFTCNHNILLKCHNNNIVIYSCQRKI